MRESDNKLLVIDYKYIEELSPVAHGTLLKIISLMKLPSNKCYIYNKESQEVIKTILNGENNK